MLLKNVWHYLSAIVNIGKEQAHPKFLSTICVDLKQNCTASFNINMILRIATPSVEELHTLAGTLFKWSDNVHKLTFIIPRHNDSTHVICVNDQYDQYDTAYSTKDDEQDLVCRVRWISPTLTLRRCFGEVASRVSTALVPTARTCQANNTALIKQGMTLYYHPFTQCCTSQAAVTPLSFMRLTNMHMSWSQSQSSSTCHSPSPQSC